MEYILFFMIYGIPNISTKKEDNIQNNVSHTCLSLSEPYVIENSNIITKNLLITNNNGLVTINGTIENTSKNELTGLNFVYTLYDDSNNIFFEFEIFISDLAGYNSTSFSSICLKDLSNITKYSVSLIP